MNANETINSYTYNNAHVSNARSRASKFECIGNFKCKCNGSTRVRKLWKLCDTDNGLAYWRPKGCHWLVPVCKLDELS